MGCEWLLILWIDWVLELLQSFYFVDVHEPILVADFLVANNLAVYLKGSRLIDVDRVPLLTTNSIKVSSSDNFRILTGGP